MKINRIYIKNFGGISDREYMLSDGLNVIFGENESGKSTFLSFIRFVFYGAKKKRGNALSFFDKYMPWNGTDMSGEAEFTLDGTEYSLSRTISASGRKKSVTFINKTTGDTINVSNTDDIGFELFKLREEAFLKTLFLGPEGAQIDSDGELLTRISNVAQSGDETVSYQAICAKINSMINDMTSTRKNNAVIPDIEKRLQHLNSEKEKLEETANRKEESAKSLSEIESKLAEALKIKKELSDKASAAKQYADYIAYEKCAAKLKEAENTYSDALTVSIDKDSKYDIIKTISPADEEILLKDNTAEVNELQMHTVLMRDKLKSAKTSFAISGIAALVCAICGIFVPLLFIGTVICTMLAIYFKISANKISKGITDAETKFSQADSKKSEILKKYNLESIDHYKALKRELADANARDELQATKLSMTKEILNERKAEFDAILKTVTEKYGSTDNLKCNSVDIDESTLTMGIKKADEDIIRYTADSAVIKKESEESDEILQKIANVNSEIQDLTLSLNDAQNELRILNLATEILEESYNELKSNFAPRLAKSTAKIFNELTGGKYGELIVNDAFEIQIKNDGKYENSNFFSSGTIQQLYFSLRLGIIELIMGNYPLFIDDAFITYDDSRFANANKFLNNYSADNQIIFCTCHTREGNMQDANIMKF